MSSVITVSDNDDNDDVVEQVTDVIMGAEKRIEEMREIREEIGDE